MGPWSLALPHLRRRAVPAHVARRSGQDEARARPAQGGDDRLRPGADRGRRRRADAARPRHRRPRLGRLLPPLPARHAHRVRRGARRRRSSCTSAAARSTAWATSPRPAWRRSTTTRRTTPAESMASVDGPHQPRRQHQQPRDALLEGARRGARRGSREPRRRRPDDRAGVRDPAADADREPARDPRRRRRVAREQLQPRRGSAWPS